MDLMLRSFVSTSSRKCKIKLRVYAICTFGILFAQLQCHPSAASVFRGNTNRNGVDLSLESDTTGFEVVESCLHKIHRSQIFPQDFDFLQRTAMVESGYGLGLVEANNFTGGIWRVDKDKFDLTKTFTLKSTSRPNSSVQIQQLKEARRKIKKQFSIHWMTTTWDDLRKPFYSALAFRLFFHWIQYQDHTQLENISNQSASSDNHKANQQQQYYLDQDQVEGQQKLDEQIPIPETLEQQAAHWAKYYHNNTNDLAEEDFIYILEALESKRKTGTYSSSCGGKAKMDLVVLLDGSTGVEEKNFEKAKLFVADLFNLYSFPYEEREGSGDKAESETETENTGIIPGPAPAAALVRFGFVVFSSKAFTMFTLSNKLTRDQMRSFITGTKHPSQIQSRGTPTDTNSGILEAIKLFTDPDISYSHSDRDRDLAGVAKVMIILTNGYGNVHEAPSFNEGKDEMAGTDTGVLPPIMKARELNITTFCVSIGPNFQKDELLQLAHGQPSHVFSLTDYQHLKKFYQRLNAAPCSTIATVPNLEFSQIARQIFDDNTNETILVTSDSLHRKEIRHYRFDLPKNSDGLTVFLTSEKGHVKGFYSYLYGEGIPMKDMDTVLFPSSVLHSGVLSEGDNGTFISSSVDFDSNLSPNTLTQTSAAISVNNSKIKRSSEPSTNNGNDNGEPMEGTNTRSREKRIQELRKRSKSRRMDEIRTMLHLWFEKENGEDYPNDDSLGNSDSGTDDDTSDNSDPTEINQNEDIRASTVLITIQGFEILNNYTIQTVSGNVQFQLSPLVNNDSGSGTGTGVLKLKAKSKTTPRPTPSLQTSYSYVTLLFILLVHFLLFSFIIVCILVGRKIFNSRRD